MKSFKNAALAAVSALALTVSPAFAGPSFPPGSGAAGVTSVATGACLTGGPITTTGTISGSYVNRAVTTTSDTILSTDACKIVTYNNASAVASSIPQATGSFGAGFSFDVENLGVGTVTLTPVTSTINGAATLTIATGKSCTIWSDGTNWQIFACTAISSGSSGITVGTTAIASGTTTRLLYDNAGVVGESSAITWNGTTLTLSGFTGTGTIDLSGAANRNINMNATSEIDVGGAQKIAFSGGSVIMGTFLAGGGSGFGASNSTPSCTSPSLTPNYTVSDGLGQCATHQLALISNSTDIANVTQAGLIIQSGVVGLKGYAFASLPGSPVAGYEAYVTDQTAACSFGATPVGGGSNKCKVWYNGTAWVDG